jgi:hypothetical protein
MNDALNAVPNMVNNQVRSTSPALALEQAVREDDVLGHEDLREYALQLANDLTSQNPNLTTKQALSHTRTLFERMGSRVSGVDLEAAKAQQAKTTAASTKPATSVRQEGDVTIKSGPVDDWVQDWFGVDSSTDAAPAPAPTTVDAA